AYDAAGMAEAVGTLYEAATGLEPATRWNLPAAYGIAPAKQAPPRAPELATAWQVLLPDRAAAIKALSNGRLIVLTQDGTLSAPVAQGKVDWQQTMSGGESWTMVATPDSKLIVIGASQHLVGFDGQGKQIFDVPVAVSPPVPVATFVAVAIDGTRFAV